MAASLTTRSVDIAPGDTLSELAAEHGVTVSQLVEWNDITDPDFILAGDSLVISVDGPDGPRTHTIERGDTLSAIAARVGISVGRLVRINELADADRIVQGHVLLLDEPPAHDTEYTVEPGDTLLAIARAHGLTTEELAAANSLDDPDLIVAGKDLVIPGRERGGAPTTPTTTVPEGDDSDEDQAPASPDDSSDDGPVTTTTTQPPVTTTQPPAPSTTEPPPTTTTAPAPAPGSATGLAVHFDTWSAAYGVDRALLEALLWHVSGWRADLVGADDRLGIAQLDPARVEFVEERLLGLDLEPTDAEDGIRMAARYLRYLIDRTSDERSALAAWTQGLETVNARGVSDAAGRFADTVLEIRRQRS